MFVFPAEINLILALVKWNYLAHQTIASESLFN